MRMMPNDEYLVVLICSHSNKFCLRKNICPEGTVWKFEDVICPHNMKSGLIFVHRV